jgi:hypothetical protein
MKKKNPTITNKTQEHQAAPSDHDHQHFVVEQRQTERERTSTSALRIRCEPMVNVGKLIRESGGPSSWAAVAAAFGPGHHSSWAVAVFVFPSDSPIKIQEYEESERIRRVTEDFFFFLADIEEIR